MVYVNLHVIAKLSHKQTELSTSFNNYRSVVVTKSSSGIRTKAVNNHQIFFPYVWYSLT